jgi:hypothetical protein
MELKFSEINNINTKNPYENVDYNSYDSKSNNSEKYWEKNTQKQTQPKKKVSFDDILSNMNLVVNKSGILQFMSHNNPNEEDQQQYQEQQYQEQQYQQPQQQYKQPLDPSVKNSFIYNKYFKDYQDAHPSAPQVRVPKTMEEYKKMLLEDKIKAIEQKKRISEIKSTKLMFTTTPSNQINPSNSRNIQASKNNLRMMSFR